jgi:hypothetical protein
VRWPSAAQQPRPDPQPIHSRQARFAAARPSHRPAPKQSTAPRGGVDVGGRPRRRFGVGRTTRAQLMPVPVGLTSTPLGAPRATNHQGHGPTRGRARAAARRDVRLSGHAVSRRREMRSPVLCQRCGSERLPEGRRRVRFRPPVPRLLSRGSPRRRESRSTGPPGHLTGAHADPTERPRADHPTRG